MRITRRLAIGGAATAAAAGALGSLLPTTSRAQGEASTPTGVFSFKFGDGEIVQVFDGARTFPMPENFLVNVSKEETAAAYEALHMPKGQLTLSFSPVIVKMGGKTIAIDTGNGLGAFAASKGAVGNTRENMKAAGIDANAVDIVLISHFHGDHINGLKNADGTPAYPNAEIKVPATEWAFWRDEANASKTNASNKGNFANVKKVFDGLKPTPYENGKEVAPGITSYATPGHTPGHTSFILASGSKRLAVQGDVTNHPDVFMRHPGWHATFDNDGGLSEQTRRKFYDMALAEKLPIIGYHFPFATAGYVEKDGDGYRLIHAHAIT